MAMVAVKFEDVMVISGFNFNRTLNLNLSSWTMKSELKLLPTGLSNLFNFRLLVSIHAIRVPETSEPYRQPFLESAVAEIPVPWRLFPSRCSDGNK